MAAVLGETLELYGPEPDFDDESDDDEGDDEEFNFTGQGMAIAILLFLARREGLTGEEFTEVLWENAAGGDVDEDDEELSDELAEARERWEEEYGDPARLLLDRLHTVLAITETTTSSGSRRWRWPRCTSSWSRPGWTSRCCRRPPPS